MTDLTRPSSEVSRLAPTIDGEPSRRRLAKRKRSVTRASAILAVGAATLIAAPASQAAFYAQPIDGPMNDGCYRTIDGRYFYHGESYTQYTWVPGVGHVPARTWTCLDGVWH